LRETDDEQSELPDLHVGRFLAVREKSGRLPSLPAAFGQIVEQSPAGDKRRAAKLR
jgi:hypothetical protein